MKSGTSQSSRQKKNVLKQFGSLLENGLRKGMNKIGNILKDDPDSDNRIFSYLRFFVDDKGIAAVTPSSRFLVRRAVNALGIKPAQVVVEYGAAEGVMTRQILKKLGPQGRLLAIELNDNLFRELRRIRDPRLITWHGDVRQIDSLAAHFGLGKVDAVISGVPFAFLSTQGRTELLAKTADLLKPSGRFVAYQVTTHLIPLLRRHFKKVETEFELRNFPPHFVFTAYK